MKFALLGLDADTAKLATAVLASAEHELIGYLPLTVAETDDASLNSVKIDSQEPWIASLHGLAAEVVIVARNDDSQALIDILRQLTESRLPVVLSHPANLAVMVYYEIELLASESSTPVVPLFLSSWQPAIREAVGRMHAGQLSSESGEPIGTPRQVEIERRLGSEVLPDVLRVFSHDVDTMRLFTGDLTEVAAMSASGGAECLPLSAQLSGPDGMLARWSATATEDAEGGRITFVGQTGRCTLDLPDDPAADAATLSGIADELQSPVKARQHWRDVIQSLELTEALEKSLRKGRVMRLNLEGRGESAAFKGTMASLGCGLLVGGLLLFLASAVLLKFAQASGLVWLARSVGAMPYALAAVLCLFLLIQLFRYLIPSVDDGDPES